MSFGVVGISPTVCAKKDYATLLHVSVTENGWL
jgi:hypothetical protein